MKNAVTIFCQNIDEWVPSINNLDPETDYEFLVVVTFLEPPYMNVICCCPDESTALEIARQHVEDELGFRQDITSTVAMVLHEIVADDEPECWQEGPMPTELLVPPYNPRTYWEHVAYDSGFNSPLGWAAAKKDIPSPYREMCHEAYEMGWKDKVDVNEEREA